MLNCSEGFRRKVEERMVDESERRCTNVLPLHRSISVQRLSLNTEILDCIVHGVAMIPTRARHAWCLGPGVLKQRALLL